LKMNSVTNRLNAIFGYGSMVLFIVLITNGMSHFVLETNPQVSLKLNRLEQVGVFGESDIASLSFDLKADLSSLFHWNTKNIFVWVTCTYATPDRPINQVVVWDAVIQTKEESVLTLKRQMGEYNLIDQSRGLVGNSVNLTFSWNRIPVTGLLTTETLGHSSFVFEK